MRIVLLLSLLLVPAYFSAQTPPPAQTPPAKTPPAKAPPPGQPPPPTGTAKPPTSTAKPRTTRPPAQSRTALVVTATDPTGKTLPGVRVEVLGAADRVGETDESGQLRFANMRAGTYRVRFSGPTVIMFEREATVRAGQTADLDVTLNPAPPVVAPQQAPAPPTPTAPQAAGGPLGKPVTLDIPEFADRNLIRREPRRDSLIGCSGNARATLVQLNEPQPERLYENAETMFYVVAGEGTLRMDGRETTLIAGRFALVPRGTSFGIARRGRNPIVLLAVLSGEPCESTP